VGLTILVVHDGARQEPLLDLDELQGEAGPQLVQLHCALVRRAVARPMSWGRRTCDASSSPSLSDPYPPCAKEHTPQRGKGTPGVKQAA